MALTTKRQREIPALSFVTETQGESITTEIRTLYAELKGASTAAFDVIAGALAGAAVAVAAATGKGQRLLLTSAKGKNGPVRELLACSLQELASARALADIGDDCGDINNKERHDHGLQTATAKKLTPTTTTEATTARAGGGGGQDGEEGKEAEKEGGRRYGDDRSERRSRMTSNDLQRSLYTPAHFRLVQRTALMVSGQLAVAGKRFFLFMMRVRHNLRVCYFCSVPFRGNGHLIRKSGNCDYVFGRVFEYVQKTQRPRHVAP